MKSDEYFFSMKARCQARIWLLSSVGTPASRSVSARVSLTHRVERSGRNFLSVSNGTCSACRCASVSRASTWPGRSLPCDTGTSDSRMV